MRIVTAHGEDLVEVLDESTQRLELSVLGEAERPDSRTVYELSRERDRYAVRRVVGRAADQHGCTGKRCAHPDHRRDVHYAATLLDMLDLPREREPVDADRLRRS